MDAGEWDELARQLRSAHGPFDAIAVYEQPQATRRGCALLLIRADRVVAFVKLRIGEEARLARTRRVLGCLRETPPRTFWVPHPIGAGRSGTVEWLALSPLPVHPHQPARRPPLADVVSDVQRSLARLPRPDGIPGHWVPMHGDLTPWNLRVTAGRRLALIDWEDAGWGPPGADAAYFGAVTAALWGMTPDATTAEVASFWRQRIRGRSPGDIDSALLRNVDGILAEMTRRGRAAEQP